MTGAAGQLKFSIAESLICEESPRYPQLETVAEMFKYTAQRILRRLNQSKFISSRGGSLVRAFSVVSNKQLRNKGYSQLLAFTVALSCVTYQCVQASPAYNFWDTVNIANVKKDIAALIDAEDDKRGDGTGIGRNIHIK